MLLHAFQRTKVGGIPLQTQSILNVPFLFPSAMKKISPRRRIPDFHEGVYRALVLAAREARKIARRYGTPIYVWENGRVVAKKP